MKKKNKTCDGCAYYDWYWNRCRRFDCETDPRGVCYGYVPAQTMTMEEAINDLKEEDK